MMMEIFENVVLPKPDNNKHDNTHSGVMGFHPLYKILSCIIIINMNIIKSKLLNLEIREMYPVFYVYPALHLY